MTLRGRRSPLLHKAGLRPVAKRKRPYKAKLTALCRRLVVELRDKKQCQRCPNSGHDLEHRNRSGLIVFGPPQIHWAHVKAGRAESITYHPAMSMALCAGCHFWYDANGNGKQGTESRRWWAAMFPDRDLKLRLWETDRNRAKFDPVFTQLYLEQEIRKYEGGE